MSDDKPRILHWPPTRIQTLREALGLTRTEMGLILGFGSAASDAPIAYKAVWRLEEGRTGPTGAVCATLDRLRRGALDAHEELRVMQDALDSKTDSPDALDAGADDGRSGDMQKS